MQTTIRVDPKTLTFSPWNVNSVSPENMKKLKESIRRNGIFRPVVVRETEMGELQVIAGEHTTRVAIELGYADMDVYNLGPISLERAKEISIIDNQHYGVEDVYGLAELLKEIEGDPGDFLPFSEAELNKIFSNSKIDLDSLELPDEDASRMDFDDKDEGVASAPITHQIMRFKVPMADAEFVQKFFESVMKRQGFSGGDSLANAGDALVWICNNYRTE